MLSEQVSVFVSPEHRFGTDAFLLASFASPRRKDAVCDLGTGCGIIPLIFCKHDLPRLIVGVDIQEQAIAQFKTGIEFSSPQTEVIPLCGDLKNIESIKTNKLQSCSFDIVTCNPPFKKEGGGILSKSPAEQIARHEVLCDIEDVCRCAKKLLRFGGRLCVCQRPERLADVMEAMRKNDIEPKRLRFVAKSKESEPWLFLLEGKKSSKPFLRVLPSLFLYEENGEYTKELQNIYGTDNK